MKNIMQALTLSFILGGGSGAAFADMAVIVNRHAPFNVLKREQVALLFMKKTSAVGPFSLTPLDLPKDSDVRRRFYQQVANRTPDYMLAYWSRLLFTGRGAPPEQVSNDEEMLLRVAREPALIGYLDASKVTDKIKIVLLIKE